MREPLGMHMPIRLKGTRLALLILEDAQWVVDRWRPIPSHTTVWSTTSCVGTGDYLNAPNPSELAIHTLT